MAKCPECAHLLPDDAGFCSRCGAPLLPPAPAESPRHAVGAVVGHGRYRIESQLGEGGMGSVFRAQDLRLNRAVALKVLNAELAAHPTARTRMTREANALARIEHPNVVRVIDIFDEGAELVLVLELLPGGTLADRIARGPVPEPEALRLMAEILAGLSAIHSAGLVHRDLKPGNVMFAAGGAAKVGDLGIAHDSTVRGVTKFGATMGTAEYMCPEQIRGEPTDARADVYAAGIVMYEMLTGDVPFRGTSDFDIAKAHVERDPDLGRLRALASPGCVTAISKALAKRRDDRWATAGAMLDGLTRGVAIEPSDVGGVAPHVEQRVRDPFAPPRASVIAEIERPMHTTEPPPGLSWVAVLLLSIVTCGVFLSIWMLIQANWVKRVQPSNKAVVGAVLGIVAIVIVFAIAFLEGAGAVQSSTTKTASDLLAPVSWVTYLVAVFHMRSVLNERFGAGMGGIATFFFGVLYIQWHFADLRSKWALAERGADSLSM